MRKTSVVPSKLFDWRLITWECNVEGNDKLSNKDGKKKNLRLKQYLYFKILILFIRLTSKT